MPKRFDPDPATLRGAFPTSASGLTPGQLRSRSLQTSFRGVRSTGLDLNSLEHRCAAYTARMHPTAAFSHQTAALLWGIPLALRHSVITPLHVSSPSRAPRGSGIAGHRDSRLEVAVRKGLRVTDAVNTWCDLASDLSLPDLVAAGDYVITGDPYNNVLPLASADELQASAQARAGQAGQRARNAALALIKDGPLSRPESLLRLLICGAGLPHPKINLPAYDGRGSFIAMPDLCWPGFMVALEYEGDKHRERRRFRRDINRVERLIDHGWLVMKVSADDLFDLPRELVARVASRLVSRGWVAGPLVLPRVVQFER